MSKTFSELMRTARALVSGGRLVDATAAIQEALGARTPRQGGGTSQDGPTLEHRPDREDASQAAASPASIADRFAPFLAGRPRFQMKRAGGPTPAPIVPEGARFETHAYAGAAGGRGYKLYVPAFLPAGPRPLILMLHGCTQDPDDFARGTRMNALAEEAGFLVAYPEQPSSANARLCWNWFEPAHQGRDRGEPAILAGIVAEIAAAHPVDAASVFVAGLSAGGAMAAVLGATHPDLFAAVGVHSGLPYGAARDVGSALAVMRSGRVGSAPASLRRGPRVIVFHGDADRTVHPANGDAVAGPPTPGEVAERGAAGGRSYVRRVRAGGEGRPAVEAWSVEGLGHAWSGGDAGGTHADPAGPDASREMVRFFLAGADRT